MSGQEGVWSDVQDTTQISTERAVNLNGVFFNVFLNYKGDEETVTVAADGTIFQTICVV